MRLLHLSDIHFRSPDCLSPEIDGLRPYRTLLAQDVLHLCQDDRPVDAILVGGDIAFKGHSDEYAAAKQWLLELAGQCGCSLERIYVVPGNHDVDRGICTRSVSIELAQDAIANARDGERERTLRRYLSDPDMGRALFQPLAAYNEFAASFGCNVYPSQPFWTDTVDLGGGVSLRLFGLTSTLISGQGGRDDAPGRLYLSPLQTVLNPDTNVVNLVLCHHPPSWYLDHGDVDDKVNSRARLQFFGHEHRQRCTRDPGYMRFCAGAVHPDQMEREWRPGYNIVDLEMVGVGLDRKLNVRAHVRNYQHQPEMFVAVMAGRGQEVWTHVLDVPQFAPLGPAIQPIAVQEAPLAHTKVASAAHEAVVTIATEASSSEATMSTPSTKRLMFRFWNLSISQRRELALKLALITEQDLATPEPERYAKALQIAVKENLLLELAREIEVIENKKG